MNSQKSPKESISTTATYGNATIYCTNRGNYIVSISNTHYPAKPNTLSGAKKMIDDANKARMN